MYLRTILVVIVAAGFGFFSPSVSLAARDFGGYAWSETIGWISLQGTNYKLSADETTGVMSGYAWSPNIGWVSAQSSDLVGCPVAPCEARLDSSDRLNGWLRALSGGTAESGGWSGWIRLRGTATDGSPYGPQAATGGLFSGYAWGSTVVGWLDFAYAVLTPPQPLTASGICSSPLGTLGTVDWTLPPGYTTARVEVRNTTTGTLLFSVDSTASSRNFATIAGNSYSWTVQALDTTSGILSAPQSGSFTCANPPITVTGAGATCDAATGVARLNWNFVGGNTYRVIFNGVTTSLIASTPWTTGGLAPGSTNNWSIAACNPTCGVPTTGTVSCDYTTLPSITFGANSTLIRSGQTAQLYWTITAPYAMNCEVFGTNPRHTFTHASGTTQITSASPFVTQPLTNTSRFMISCATAGLPSPAESSEVRVDVVPSQQEI
jgi:hypothetical protein